ncbi:MAG: transposase [Streptococcus sp.]|nr:transposase [Streptococcus sp.]
MVSLIDLYGMEAVKKGKKRYYSPGLKQDMIDKILLEGRLLRSVSLEYVLLNLSLLKNWVVRYKKNGYTIVEKTRGRVPKMGRKRKYSSYQGEIGKKVENLIQRQFEAERSKLNLNSSQYSRHLFIISIQSKWFSL